MALFPIAKPKAHSLTGRITQPLLLAAFKAVKRNRGAAGIDKVSLKMFERNLADNLLALERDLKDGSFQPFPLRRKFIPKEPGKFRPLGIPAVRDRVAQEALRRRLHPIFEPLFHEASFGFRPKRNCHQALEQILTEISWIRSDFHFFPPPAGRNSLNCKPRIFQNPQVETYSLPHRSLKVIFCPLKKCFCVSTLAKKTARCIATGASSKTADCALVTPLNAPSFT